MSQRKCAKLLGYSHAYINKLVKQGVIPARNDGKVDPDAAKRAIEAHKDPSRDAQREANEKRRNKNIFDLAGAYESVADMSEEEKKRYEEERKAEAERAKKAIEEIERAGLDVSEELKELAAKSSLNEAKTISEILNAKLKEIAYKKEIGELVPKAEVEREAFEVARRVRDMVLSVPDRVAAMVAVENDQRRVKEILLEELHHALEALTRSVDERV